MFIRFLAATNMPNSVERSSKSKKNNFDNFIWSDDQVELLFKCCSRIQNGTDDGERWLGDLLDKIR